MAPGSGAVTGAVSVFRSGPAELGEAPLWDPRRGILSWVDIVAGAVYAHDGDSARPLSGAVLQREAATPGQDTSRFRFRRFGEEGVAK